MTPEADALATVFSARPGVSGSRAEFVPTPTSELIIGAAEVARHLGCVAVIRGAAGIGKTAALREYTRRDSAANCFAVGEIYGGERDIERLLMDRFSLGCFAGRSRYEAWQQLKRWLWPEGPFASCEPIPQHDFNKRGHRLLIFDGADAISLQEALILCDLSKHVGVGVIFAGSAMLFRRVRNTQGAFVRQWQDSNRQIDGYVSVRREIRGVEKADVLALLHSAQVANNATAVTDVLWSWAEAPGALRNVRNIIEVAESLAGERVLTTESIEAAVQAIGLNIGRVYANGESGAGIVSESKSDSIVEQ